MGVVEDNNDPQLLGRCRVRCFGIHPTDTTKVPTEDLPWAYVVSGTYSSAYKPPALNEWVFGFFIDGKSAQQPVLLGTFLGMPTMAPAAYGDSNGGFTSMGDGATMAGLHRPDLSRLATGEELEKTSVLAKNAIGGQPVRTSNGNGWQTPKSPYNARYPHNYVHETQSGHVLEMDDTPGNERVNLYHRSGSHIEINSSGAMTLKSTGSTFVVVENIGYVRIMGDANVTVEGRASILVENDCDFQVDGNLTQRVFGDYTLEVSGRHDVNVGEALRMRGAGVSVESAVDNVDIISKNNMNLQSGNGLNVKTAKDVRIGSGGKMSLGAEGKIQSTGSEIHFNSDDNPADDPAAASPTDMKAPGQRKTIAYKGMAEPFDSGVAADDAGAEGNESPQPTTTEATGTDAQLDADRQKYGPMLDTIGTTEGTDRGRGYNETLGYGKFTGGAVDLESMTINQVMALQTDMLNNPTNNFNSSALGRYQITRTTLQDFAPRLGMDGNTLFNRDTQDKLGIAILKSTNGSPSKLRGRWTSLNRLSDSTLTNVYYGSGS
jgi:muramidase (phage lysozyme)